MLQRNFQIVTKVGAAPWSVAATPAFAAAACTTAAAAGQRVACHTAELRAQRQRLVEAHALVAQHLLRFDQDATDHNLPLLVWTGIRELPFADLVAAHATANVLTPADDRHGWGNPELVWEKIPKRSDDWEMALTYAEAVAALKSNLDRAHEFAAALAPRPPSAPRTPPRRRIRW